jgi:hypothetical protein
VKQDEDEHLKLWKSLYYCYWMSDKGPVQQDLADKLAKVMTLSLSTSPQLQSLMAC